MQWFKSKIHYSVIYFHRSINRLIVWWLLVNRVLYLPCRLLQKYKISEDSFQPGKVIFDNYVNNCPEKENCLLQEIEVGRILKEVFPDIRRVQRQVKGLSSDCRIFVLETEFCTKLRFLKIGVSQFM